MKNLRLLLPFLLCMTWFSIQAQPPGGPGPDGPPPPMSKQQREEIESMKIAFITKKLSLTPDEAKKFWPVYDQFSKELRTLRDNHRNMKKDNMNDLDSLSDKEVEKVVDGEIAFRQQELDILKKYNAQFKQVLPMKKVAQLYRAEEEFKRELLEKLRDRKQGGKKQDDRNH